MPPDSCGSHLSTASLDITSRWTTRLAEKLYSEHLPASDCHKLIHFDALAPPPNVKILDCIIHYAKIAQDPSICERLMPNRYGLDCVLGAMKESQCTLVQKRVWWVENNYDRSLSFQECSQSPLQHSPKGNDCCTIAQVRLVKSMNDCSSLISKITLFDECQFGLAFKKHDPSSCDPIQDTNIKAACLVAAKALEEDPSICTGCAIPVERIEDLPR